MVNRQKIKTFAIFMRAVLNVSIGVSLKGRVKPVSILYIVVVVFVIALLLSIPLFPFWKVWKRLQTHHPDIWASAGPFDVVSMITSPGLVGIFASVLIRLETDKDRHAKDPPLAKWTH